MEALFDAVFALGAFGFRRTASREADPLPPNGWLAAAGVVLGLFTAALLAFAALLVYATGKMWSDWLFMFLGMILFPVFLAAAGMLVSVAVWSVPVSCRLVKGDAAVRPDLGVAGGLALAVAFLASGIPSDYGYAPAAVLALAGAYMLGVALWPLPWAYEEQAR